MTAQSLRRPEERPVAEPPPARTPAAPEASGVPAILAWLFAAVVLLAACVALARAGRA